MAAPSFPVGNQALTGIESLPFLRRGAWLVGTDSHDVTGGNNDGFQALYSYLYKDGDEYVIFEESGPGCIYEIRSIGFKGNLKIYLDGETSPSQVIPFRDTYNGQRAPFLPPLVAEDETAHGSCWNYVPIPYQKGCKLTTEEMGPPRFFNIFAHKYAEGTEMPRLDLTASLDGAMEFWANPAKPPASSRRIEEIRKKARLAPRKGIAVIELAGSGAIQRLRIRPIGNEVTVEEMAADLVLKAYWDGQITPQVDSPVGSFFGLGCPRALKALKFQEKTPREGKHHTTGRVPTRSLAVGQDEEGWLYCNLPMPFWKSARVDLFNGSENQTYEFEVIADHSMEAYPEDSGYLYARWRDENPLRPSEDFCVVDTQGHGHYVGCVITFTTIDHDSPYRENFIRGHLEGDARFYADDIRTPLVASTGTEEYFNWGWYDLPKHDSPFTYPVHGYPLHVADNQDHSVMYRFHVSDIAPFYRSFRFDLEHGPTGLVDAHYSGTGFYYQRPAPALVLTDELDICDAGSEKAHAYQCEIEVDRRQYILPYEGAHQLPIAADAPVDREHVVKDLGRTWEGVTKFTAKINPGNKGVKLRRRSYYGFGAQGDLSDKRVHPTLTAPQAVAVYVDDQHVGDWRIAARHARATWLDSDFEIDGAATEGKDSIQVRVETRANTKWDDFTYWVYSYL